MSRKARHSLGSEISLTSTKSSSSSTRAGSGSSSSKAEGRRPRHSISSELSLNSASTSSSSSRTGRSESERCPRKMSTPELLAVKLSRRDQYPLSRSRSSEATPPATGSEAGDLSEPQEQEQEECIVLTDEQKAELKEAFGMFEKAKKGRIQARDLGELLRCLGWNPSEQDLEEARHELEVTARGTISFADVESYVARRGGIFYGNNAEEDIQVAFQVLDKSGNGRIEVDEFRHFMTTMGDKMSSEEVEDILKSALKDGHEFIEYKDLIRAMQQQQPT